MIRTSKKGVEKSTEIVESDIKWIASAIFILAGSGLAFQVMLTRAFSLIFQYHFVFLVVSLSILGLGLGAALGYVAYQIFRIDDHNRIITFSILTLSGTFPLIAWLLTNINSSEVTTLAVVIAIVPFFLIGWINALVYTNYADRSNLIYGVDLVGAAVGLVVAPQLLVIFGPTGVTIILGGIAGLAALLMTFTAKTKQTNLQVLAAVFLVVFMALALVNRSAEWLTYDLRNLTNAPPDKTLVHVLNNPALDAEIVESKWGAFAQVDVVETNDSDAYFVFTDAGAGSIMLRYDPDADEDQYEWLKRETVYLPFEIGSVENTLVIGSGAGYDIVMAELAGAGNITAVEINPTIVDITREYADYNGNILDLPNVSTVITDGRNFVDRSEDKFDLIYLNLVYSQAARPSSSSLAENYAFTQEALQSYWNRLEEDGRIAFVTHSGVHGVRLLMTTLAALEEEGLTLQEALLHIALVKSPNPLDPTVTPSVVIISREALSEEDALELGQAATQHGLDPLYIPYIFDTTLERLANGSMTLDEYVASNTDFDISPTTDNRPFFYHLDDVVPYPLDNLFLFSILLLSGYFIVAAAFQPNKPENEWTRIIFLVYFALLGTGFLLVEVALLHRFRLLLGTPVLTFSVTVGALLLGGGLGSLFGQRFDTSQLPKVIKTAALGITFWLLASSILYDNLVDLTLSASLSVRTIVSLIALAPAGFMMGVPFPSGLRLAGSIDPEGIPLFWGMNASASMFGAVLATIVALLMGFQMALLLGAGMYFLVAVLAQLTWQKTLFLKT